LLLGGKSVESFDVGDLAIRVKREFDGFFALAGFSCVGWILRAIRRHINVRSHGIGDGSIRIDESGAQTGHGPASIDTQIFDADKQKKILIGLAAGWGHGRGDRAFCIRVGFCTVANLIPDGLTDAEFREEHDAVRIIASRARNRRSDHTAAEQS
jgi:hypothetical protein